MPWAETEFMKERMRFVTDAERGLYSMTELCARYGISRRTGYKWLDRYALDGPPGLRERSRAPRSVSASHGCGGGRGDRRGAVPASELGTAEAVGLAGGAAARLDWPAASTAGDLLRRCGLVSRRRHRRHWGHPGRRPPSARTRMICGRRTSRGSSPPATVSTVIRSPLPTCFPIPARLCRLEFGAHGGDPSGLRAALS